MKYSIPTLMALRQDSDIVCHWKNSIKDCQSLRHRQGNKALLSEASLNQRANATVARLARSRTARSSKNLAPKSQTHHQPSSKIKPKIQTNFAVSEAGFARFLKEHTSPKHQRVTAGGRIVPMEPTRQTVSSDEHILSQTQDISSLVLNAPTENGVQHDPHIHTPIATDFYPHQYPDGFGIVSYPSFVHPAAAAPQVFGPSEPAGGISSVHPQFVPNRMVDNFVLFDAPSIAPAGQLAPESRPVNSTEQWSEYHSGNFEIPNAVQSNSNPENWNTEVSPGMEDGSPHPSTPTMETVRAVIPGLVGEIGINDLEFSMLFEMFNYPFVPITHELAHGLLHAIRRNLIDEWYGEHWLTARTSLVRLIRLCEERLRIVNRVAASNPHTREDLVRQRCYYINLRAMFSDTHDELTNEWADQDHKAPFALADLNLGSAGTNVAKDGTAWAGNASGNTSRNGAHESGADMTVASSPDEKTDAVGVLSGECNVAAVDDAQREDTGSGARSHAHETGAAEGIASVPGGERKAHCGSSVDQESAGEAERGSGVPVLNTIEPGVMSSVGGGIGGDLRCVDLGNEADEGDGVVANHQSESALPGASVHQKTNQRPNRGVALSLVPICTKAEPSGGGKAPFFTSLLARITGKKAAVPRSSASVAVSTAMAGVVANTTNPTLSPPVGKPGETLSSGRFPID